MAEQWIKEGKGAIKWTRLSCRSFAANALRLQLHVLGYNLGNFIRMLAIPKAAGPWSLTSLREKLIKIGAKVGSRGRYVRGNPVADRPAAGTARASMRSAGGQMRQGTTAEVRLDQGKGTRSSVASPAILGFRSPGHRSWATFVSGGPKARPWPWSVPESGECRISSSRRLTFHTSNPVPPAKFLHNPARFAILRGVLRVRTFNMGSATLFGLSPDDWKNLASFIVTPAVALAAVYVFGIDLLKIPFVETEVPYKLSTRTASLFAILLCFFSSGDSHLANA